MCEEVFGGKLDVTEKTPEPFESEKSHDRQYRDWLYERNEEELEILKKMKMALEKMDSRPCPRDALVVAQHRFRQSHLAQAQNPKRR